MLEQLKQWFVTDQTQPAPSTTSKELAITALLGEVMMADGQASREEQQQLEHLLIRLTQQSAATVQQLLAEYKSRQDQVVSLYEFTAELKNLPIAEREDILYALWAVAFSDGQVDPQEEGVIRQVADLLYIPHSRFIWLKHQAQKKQDTPHQPG
ncbi:TerB family tellurite resistance protein [Oceanisphaera sp.]|uniref:tellurite resistance TerB family protein n=1 Tax=Oceanisphaera sp. TaxID=1929979 RepID=UPI003A8D9D10